MKQPLVLIGPYGGAEWEEVALGLAPVADVTLVGLDDENFTATARRVLNAAPPIFAVGGFCSGAQVIFELLRLAPHRVSAVAFVNCSARADNAYQADARRNRIEKLRGLDESDFNGEEYTAQALSWMLADPNSHARSRASNVLKSLRRTAAIAQQEALLRRSDARPLIKDLSVPALVIGGEHDRICPPALSVELAGLTAHSRLAILERCGHLAPVECAPQVTQLAAEWIQLAQPPR